MDCHSKISTVPASEVANLVLILIFRTSFPSTIRRWTSGSEFSVCGYSACNRCTVAEVEPRFGVSHYGAAGRCAAVCRRRETALVCGCDRCGRCEVIAYLVLFASDIGYASDRIEAWLNPFSNATQQLIDDTWQTRQSLYAVGSGGLLGVGIGQSRQKYLYLPEPQRFCVCDCLRRAGVPRRADYCDPVCATGLARITISLGAKDKFGMLLGTGLSVQVGLQVILNICVVCNTIPNTSISLPFFSYGGTSLVLLLAQMGIVLSISRNSNLEKFLKTALKRECGKGSAAYKFYLPAAVPADISILLSQWRGTSGSVSRKRRSFMLAQKAAWKRSLCRRRGFRSGVSRFPDFSEN